MTNGHSSAPGDSSTAVSTDTSDAVKEEPATTEQLEQQTAVAAAVAKEETEQLQTVPMSAEWLTSHYKECKFMFNIADGGFTDLHSYWADEKKDSFNPAVWQRRHDYWLLKGIMLHGYCRWTEICADPSYGIINVPFDHAEISGDYKSRFLLKRFRLLEQALAVEEQLHRASSLGLMQDPNQSVMMLHSRFTDLDCLADGHLHLVDEIVNGSKSAIKFMKKALGKMEAIVSEMKNDVNKLPAELVKLPCVTKQLNLSTYNILSKLAHQKIGFSSSAVTNKSSSSAERQTALTPSGVVKLPVANSSTPHGGGVASGVKTTNQSVIQQTLAVKHATPTKSKATPHAYSTLQTAVSSSTATAGTGSGNLVLYSGTSNATQYLVSSGGGAGSSKQPQQQKVQQQKQTQQTQQAFAISGQPHTQYIQGTDGNLYAITTTRPSQGQNLVLNTSQGVLYWPVQGNTTTATMANTSKTSSQQYTAAMPGSAAIVAPDHKTAATTTTTAATALTVAKTTTSSLATTAMTTEPSTTGTKKQVSVITID